MTASVFHTLAQPLPPSIRARAQPHWNRLRLLVDFWRAGGRLRWDHTVKAWIGSRRMAGRPMLVCIRSYRELRRLHNMGHDPADAVWKWLHWLGNERGVLYDIGSANGLEALLASHLHGHDVVMVEPYTPSIESILKTIHVVQRDPAHRGSIEVVHAACGDTDDYARLLMHGPPVAGETMNSFENPDSYCNPDDRAAIGTVVSQWVKSVTLDELRYRRGLQPPTHVKIDVDGFEGRVMRGAARLLEEGSVASWAVEVTGRTLLDEITTLMDRHGYVEVDRYEHYPGNPRLTFDLIFTRPARAADWASFEIPS